MGLISANHTMWQASVVVIVIILLGLLGCCQQSWVDTIKRMLELPSRLVQYNRGTYHQSLMHYNRMHSHKTADDGADAHGNLTIRYAMSKCI